MQQDVRRLWNQESSSTIFTDPNIPASLPSVASANLASSEAWKAADRKYFLTALIRISPALETPPPMTKISGSTTQEIAAHAPPRTVPTKSTISKASASPCFAWSNTSLAVISGRSRSVEGLSLIARISFVLRTIPVAEVYCSRFPLRMTKRGAAPGMKTELKKSSFFLLYISSVYLSFSSPGIQHLLSLKDGLRYPGSYRIFCRYSCYPLVLPNLQRESGETNQVCFIKRSILQVCVLLFSS